MTKKWSTGDGYYFPFYVRDWRSSEGVQLMTLEQRGAFIDLLSVAWLASEEPCSIPSGDAEIAALLRIAESDWKRIAPRVLAEFDDTTPGGRLRNKKLWKIYQSLRTAHRKMAQGGKTSALRRRDEHGRLLPSPDQAPTKHLGKVAGKVPSGNQNQNQNQVTTTTSAPRVKREGAPKYPNLTREMCDELYAIWSTFGAVDYPEFRGAVGPIFQVPVPPLLQDVKAAMKEAIAQAEAKGKGEFLHIRGFAQRVMYWIGEAKGRPAGVDPVTGILRASA